MSWHYSRVLEEVFSEPNSSGGEQSALLSEIDTVSRSSFVDNLKDFLIPSQSGTMLKHSTGSHLVDVWISSLRAFRANPSASQVKNSEPEIIVTFGQKPFESLGKYDPNSSSWKMSLAYCIADTTHKWPQIWPRAGMIVNGVAYQQPKWERLIREIESGLLPTPLASDHKRTGGVMEQHRKKPDIAAIVGGFVHPEYHEWLMGFPIGWTGLEPLETHRFQEWLDLHGRY